MLLGLALSVLAASPGSVTLAVFPQVIVRDGETLGPADVMVAVERSAARRPTVRVVDARVTLPADALRRVRDCGSDATCWGAALRDAGLPAVLQVIVNARVSPPVIAVRLVADGAVQHEYLDSRTSVELPLLAAVGGAVAHVLDALGHAAWAELTVEATPPEVRLWLDDPAASWTLPRVAWVAPGTVTLHAEAPGHVPTALTLALAAGEDRSVVVALEAEPAWWTSGWLWGAVGVGIAAAVTVAVLTVPGGEPCLCVGRPEAPCACR